MSNLLMQNDEARPEVDDLLRDYFQAEMPKPWPAFREPKPARAKPPASLWVRSSGRLALAASVALLVGGYWTLSGYFPPTPTSTGTSREVGDIGENFKDRKKPLTPPKNSDKLPNAQ